MLTAEQFPYTGPYGSTRSKFKSKGPTVKALRRMCWRLGLLPATSIASDEWTNDLTVALSKWDPGRSGYALGRWEKARSTRVPKGLPHAGEYALDTVACALVVVEAHGTPKPLELVYLHPAGVPSSICQGLHPTEGLPGNWAEDFCAPGGTTILAPFAGTITKLSGHDPKTGTWGPNGPSSSGDIFGWSTYLTRADGVYLYVTHEGSRLVSEGQKVTVAQPIATVGHWPHDEGRSHSHAGITSPRGQADAKRIIQAIAAAPRVAL